MRSGDPAGGASKLLQSWRRAQYGVVLARVHCRSCISVYRSSFRVLASQPSRSSVVDYFCQVCFFGFLKIGDICDCPIFGNCVEFEIGFEGYT